MRKILTFLSLMLSVLTFAQEGTVTGTVTDAQGGPLPGVNVLIKGTTTGTQTDFDGLYSIPVSVGQTINFTYIGFVPQSIVYTGQATLDIALETDQNELDEVVVVGYGTQKAADVTTAISRVKAEEIAEIPAASLEQTLQGRAAGVQVTSGGAPGERTTLRIRGLATFGDGDPLYVVDGVFTESLTNINPSSIQSVDVLKDAAAAAIYGSRGSNGVVIITTKKGKGAAGKTTFTFNTFTGLQEFNKRYDVLNTEQYIQYIREINEIPEGVPNFGSPVAVVANDPNFDGNGVETNWQDELFRTAPLTSYDFSASGSGDIGNFSVGGAFYDQDGVYIDTNFKRYTLNASSDFKISDKFVVGESLNLGYSETIAPQFSDGRRQIRNAIASAPYTPVRLEDGVSFGGSTDDDVNNSRNLVRVQDSDDNLLRSATLVGAIYGKYTILPGLTFKSQLGIDGFFNSQDNIFRAYQESGMFSLDETRVAKTRSDRASLIFTNNLNYNFSLADSHRFDITLVSERQNTRFRRLQGTSVNDVTNAINELVTTGSATTSRTEDERLISYLGRLNYNYDGKYLLSASIRRDKSSKFGLNEQVGWFPAASVGWVVSKEGFLSGSDVFTNFKLRASYGVTGNNRIANYLFQSTLAPNVSYPLNGDLNLGVGLNGFDNPNLKWEESIKQNFGVDLGFWYDQVTLSAEYFSNKSDDLLVPVNFAPSLGIAGGSGNSLPIILNAANVEVTGYEVTLGYNDYKGDFKWNFWGNISAAENVVNSTGGTEQILSARIQTINTDVSRIAEGEPIYHFYGYVAEGVYKDDQEVIDHLGPENSDLDAGNSALDFYGGDVRYKDLNGDGDITDEDRQVIGKSNPDFTYAMSLKAEYKGFDFSALFNGVEGVDAFNANVYNLTGQENVLNRGVEVLRRWRNPGDITDVPRYRFGANSNNFASTRYIEDASFLRLKNVTLGYSIPEKTLSSLLNGTFKKARLYVQGQNLLTITGYSGLDPEIQPYYDAAGLRGLNVDRGFAPPPVTGIIGLQLEF